MATFDGLLYAKMVFGVIPLDYWRNINLMRILILVQIEICVHDEY